MATQWSAMPEDVPSERRVFTYVALSLLSWAAEQRGFSDQDSLLWPHVHQLLVSAMFLFVCSVFLPPVCAPGHGLPQNPPIAGGPRRVRAA